ncbi:YopX family protein [Levilactobacillus brevis]
MIPKFRGWDRKNNVMYDFMMMCFYVNLKNVLYRNTLTDFDVDMCTGLKDVNGKKIYEGDIVRMQRPGFHEDACYEVKYFIQDVCIFQIVKVTDGSTLFESPSNGHDVEIIGNVHTNPELLEAQHE